MKNFRLLSISCALWFAACASDSPSDAGDTTTDTRPDTSEDVASDAPVDGSGEDVTADAALDVDTGADVPDDDVPPDVTQDVGAELPFDCDGGGECPPNAIFCDGNAVVFCSRCGEVLRSEICDVTEVCEEADGAASCRPCAGDECPENIDCTAGERTCLDYNTAQLCGDDGTVDSTADCPEGRRCFEGSCGSPGGPITDTCTQNIDPAAGCNGHLCVCGEEYRAAFGTADCDASGGALANGYCSTRDCADNGCDFDNEICADFSLSGAYGGEDFCLTRDVCDRAGRRCGERTGFECVELPTRRSADGPIRWDFGCWIAGAAGIGDACTSDASCLGGVCRARTVDGGETSYCASPCGESGGCPSNAACVEDPEVPGNFVCLARNNNVDCPRLDTEPLRIAATPPLRQYGGGSTSACYFAR